MSESLEPGLRYKALLGPNTHQFWIYDNEEDVYIDPPTFILEEADKIRYRNGEETADSISEAEAFIESKAAENPCWLHDGNEYDDIEI